MTAAADDGWNRTAIPGEPATSAVISQYVDDPYFVHRAWLADLVEQAVSGDEQWIVVEAATGAGKSGLVAQLAQAHPGWVCHFLRAGSRSALHGGDLEGFLLAVGHQLAFQRPELFDPQRLAIEIEQVSGEVGPGGRMVGLSVDDFVASPFLRTAVSVRQRADRLDGEMTAVRAGRITVEPRLLHPDNLAWLALFGPATVLAATAPEDRIVVVLDAVDEVADNHHGGLLDWLVHGPQLPANVRFVVASRPHRTLDRLRHSRSGGVREVRIDPLDPRVHADARAYLAATFAEPRTAGALARHGLDVEGFALELADRSRGNFAYLVAYARAVMDQAAAPDDDALVRLLTLSEVPDSLQSLYRFLVGVVRSRVERLGTFLPAANADGVGRVPAWEGVGQPILALLTVARAPLPSMALFRLAGLQVSRSDALNVLNRFASLLDNGPAGVQWFHSSFSEYLGSAQAAEPLAEDAVDCPHWHGRIVRHYRAQAPSWAEADWAVMDEYGLAHLPSHLVLRDASAAHQVRELACEGYRQALRRATGGDRAFHDLLNLADEFPAQPGDLLGAVGTAFLTGTLRAHLQRRDGALAPHALELMAALGQVDHALDQLETIVPVQDQWHGLLRIYARASEQEREAHRSRLGTPRLLALARELMSQPEAVTVPAAQLVVELAAVLPTEDMAELLRLFEEIPFPPNSDPGTRERALAAVARRAPLPDACRLAMECGSHAPLVLLELAQRDEVFAVGLLRQAAALLTAAEPVPSRPLDHAWDSHGVWRTLEAMARLAFPRDRQEFAYWLRLLELRFEAWNAARSSRHESQAETGLSEPLESQWCAVVEVLHGVAADFSVQVLEALEESDSSLWEPVSRCWQELGHPQLAQAALRRGEAALEGLKRPAVIEGLCRLALLHRGAGRHEEAEALVDRALALAEEALVAVRETPDMFGHAADGSLDIVRALADWQPERALRIAREAPSWTPFGIRWPERNVDRASLMARVGLALLDTEPTRAEAILGEIVGHPVDKRLGREAVTATGPGYELSGWQPPSGERAFHNWLLDQVAYVHVVWNSFVENADKRWYSTVNDFYSGVQPPPGPRLTTAGWGRALRFLAGCTPTDPVAAAAHLERLLDPAERAVGLAQISVLAARAGHPAAGSLRAAAGVALAEVPVHEWVLGHDDPLRTSQLRALWDPRCRTTAEFAAVVCPEDPELARRLLAEEDAAALFPGLFADALPQTVALSIRNRSTKHDAQEFRPGVLRQVERAVGSGNRHYTAVALCQILPVMAEIDAEEAWRLTELIDVPVYRAVARVRLAPFQPDPDAAVAGAFKTLGPEPEPWHLVKVATNLAFLTSDAMSEQLFEDAWRIASEAEGDQRRRAMLVLAENFASRDLLDELEAAAPGPGVPGLDFDETVFSVECFSSMLRMAPFVAPERLPALVRRAAECGWHVIMAALEHAAQTLVYALGEELIPTLQQVVTQAARCLDPARTHVDGVRVG
ncbi:hypothetical protein ACFYST_10085 [Kitasatospora sp. NPDC004614]|uniref:hypothetical protein n=1 Tax=unclassified Kitasatospora TaxID=2633591 RepID=UPI0036967B23